MTADSTSVNPTSHAGLFAPGAKKVMTSFDIKAIAGELETSLKGARIENIYQVSPFTFLIVFHPSKRLVIEAGRRIHLTRYDIQKPGSPSLFCSILRRHLRRGVVQGVSVEDFERVLSVNISSKEGARRLVAEVFGGGNLLVLDENDRIIQALTYRRMRDRNILRGEHYRLPPSRGTSLDQVTMQSLSTLSAQKGEVARALARCLGIGSPYVDEILLRAGITKTEPAADLTKDQLRSIEKTVHSLLEDLNRPRPRVVLEESEDWLDVTPFPLLIFEDKRRIEHDTFNDAADAYFTGLSAALATETKVAESEVLLEEQKRIVRQQQERLSELGDEASASQTAGDLLYIHFAEIQELLGLQRIKGSIENAKNDLVVAFNSSTEKIRVRLEGKEVELDRRLSIYENANRYYDRAKEAREKMKGLRRAIEEAENKFKTRKQVAIVEKRPRLIRERAWYEKYHWSKTENGALVIGGRDAATNEILIKKHMEPKDVVFHIDSPGASFVLLRAGGQEFRERDLMEAAEMAASYSSAWKAKAASINVYWVKPEQVSKEAPSGEYLTRGAFMIRGQKNYIQNVQLGISVGLIETDEGLRVVGGTHGSVRAQTELAIDIVPGRLSSGTLAKEMRGRLASRRLELRQNILAIPVEEFQRFIPPGGGELVRD